MSGSHGKWYVVFNGRKLGICNSWIDCKVQVNGFSGDKHQSFKTRERLRKLGYVVGNMYKQRALHMQWLASLPISNGYLLELSMQDLLIDACKKLKVPPPCYTQLGVGYNDKKIEYKYYGSLQMAVIDMPPTSKLHSGETEYINKEGVARELLRRLASGLGIKVKDFNYENVLMFEEECKQLDAENFDPVMENANLKDKLQKAKGVVA
ncbi:Ribosomal protein L9/RNase H1, N-terminal [Sesbania bispinosa]|nr:Ribosomal protein L9/RNase H1, N-terminal [Sesbania bispinosa]